jgi:RNA polymerase-binding transcription factor
MPKHDAVRARLEEQLSRLLKRVGAIESDLKRTHDRDWNEQAIELENDEVLEGLDEMSAGEVRRTRAAISRIANGTYGVCSTCGHPNQQRAAGRNPERPHLRDVLDRAATEHLNRQTSGHILHNSVRTPARAGASAPGRPRRLTRAPIAVVLADWQRCRRRHRGRRLSSPLLYPAAHAITATQPSPRGKIRSISSQARMGKIDY